MRSFRKSAHGIASTLGSRYRFATITLLLLSSGAAFASPPELSLDQALHLAVAASASSKAASASVDASREAGATASQLPDPMLKLGVDNLPVTGQDKFSPTADFMTMRRVGIEQQWVSRDKREARSERATRASELEEATYLEKVASVREEAGKAWLNVLYSQRALELSNRVKQEMVKDLAAIQASYRGAKASATDILQAKMELIQGTDDVHKVEEDLQAARIALHRWTRTDTDVVADSPPELKSHLPDVPVSELDKYHPAVLTARRAVQLADADTTVATRERNPDWSFEAGFAKRGSQYSNMVSFGVSIPLPINRAQRQDRQIAEKAALGTKARLEYEDAVVEMQSQIQTLSAQLESMKRRISELKEGLLPIAVEQVDLATSAYSSASGTLTAVFKAKRELLGKQLQINELERNAALTWAALELHIVPHDESTEVGRQK